MSPNRQVTLQQLFFGCCEIGLSGFGGVLPFARHLIVDKRQWLSAQEFNSMLSIGQCLPGPNIMNLTTMIGRHFQGARGAIVAPLGLMLFPFAIVLALGGLYAHYRYVPEIQGMLRGISSVGCGLILATGIKMLLTARPNKSFLAMVALPIISIAVFRFPLVWTMVALLPASIYIAWRQFKE